LKFIDEMLAAEDRTNKYKQDRMNALTAETATNEIAYRLLTNAALTGLRPWQKQEHKRV
jgi:hypothetical protein